MSTRYIECSESDIPAGVRFVVLGPDQGQIIEYAYGDFGREEPGYDAPYKRVIDRSLGPAPRYYRRV
jgi:hypothetical protein